MTGACGSWVLPSTNKERVDSSELSSLSGLCLMEISRGSRDLGSVIHLAAQYGSGQLCAIRVDLPCRPSRVRALCGQIRAGRGQGSRRRSRRRSIVVRQDSQARALTHHGLSYRLIGRSLGLSNNTVMEIVRRQTHKNQIPGFRSRRFSCRDAFAFGDPSSEEVAPIVLVATGRREFRSGSSPVAF